MRIQIYSHLEDRARLMLWAWEQIFLSDSFGCRHKSVLIDTRDGANLAALDRGAPVQGDGEMLLLDHDALHTAADELLRAFVAIHEAIAGF